MKKFAIKILSVCVFFCALLALVSLKTTFLATQKQTLNVFAEEAKTAELIAPPSYEEYLPLKDTQDVAVCEQFIAIADGNLLYVYDQTAEIYRTYEHDKTITKLQFDSRETLYFLDDSTYLYTLDPIRLNAKQTTLVCSNFLIVKDTFYYTNTSGSSSGIRKTPLNALNNNQATMLIDKITLFPALAFEKGELYYTDAGKLLYKINPETGGTPTLVAAFPFELLSISILDNVFTCATAEGDFISYDLLTLTETLNAQDIQPIFKESDLFSSLSLFEKHIYTVNGNRIQKYSLEGERFTDYEITASSDSISRLNGAAEVCLSDSNVFIADNGNERISIYDVSENAFLSPIPTLLQPHFIASDGNSLLAANDKELILFDLAKYNYGKALFTYSAFEGNVIGITSVYGSYYLATDKNQFLALTETNNSWSITVTQKNSTKYPSLLTSDASGNLYVRCNDSVYQYTETEFMSAVASTKEIYSSLPETTKKIAFDYRGNLYALSEKSLYRYAPAKDEKNLYAQNGVFDLTKNTPAHGVSPSPLSFALSFEENATYVLDENDYLVKRTDVKLPTLKTISVNGADEQILSINNDALQFVEIKPNALLVEFDFTRLQGSEYFPYKACKRNEKTITALKLGEVDVYNVLAVYDNDQKRYAAYLVYTTSCEEKPLSEHQKLYSETEQKTKYLTNSVSLYRIPYLTQPFAVTQMQRGSSVLLLGEINGLRLKFYYVQYTDTNGEIQTGYVPENYVTSIRSETPTQNPNQGKQPADTDAVWRLIYILLGFGVICILSDYLIIRKQNQNKDE